MEEIREDILPDEEQDLLNPTDELDLSDVFDADTILFSELEEIEHNGYISVEEGY